MIVISYDIKDDKLRAKFSKLLIKNGAIRLQYSVYEVVNTARILEHLLILIEEKFTKLFGAEDSVVVFKVSKEKLIKYGNAIHRDKDIVFF